MFNVLCCSSKIVILAETVKDFVASDKVFKETQLIRKV